MAQRCRQYSHSVRFAITPTHYLRITTMILLAVGLLCSSIQQVINSNTVSAVAPTTTSIAATSGLISGGDTVTVTGSDFTKAVNFQTLTKKWSIVSNGYNHTCAIDSNAKAYCWGYNNYGQLGNNSTTDSSVPVAVNTSGVLSGKTLVAIYSGGYHTCVLDSDGKVYCWGENNYGQLGNNSTTSSTVPVAVNTSGVLSGKVLTNISVGYAYTCAIDSTGKAYCWGLNEFGRLGDNTETQRNVPVAVYDAGVLSGKTLVAVSAGDAHGCVIDSNGGTYCWGNNYNGQLGGNSNTNSYVPVNTIIIVDNVTLVALGGSTCTNLAILSDTTLTCVTPAHAAGVVNVVLSSDDGLSTLTNAYTYYTTSSAPTITSASRASTTSVVLVWTAPSSNGYSTITDYAIQYKLSTDSTWVTFSDGVSTALTATVTGLAADSMYDFRVAAINAAGTGAYSAIVTVKGFYITVSSSETLSVGAAPGKFSSVQDTVAVDTNNAAGYSLSMQSASSNLTNSVSGSTIPTLTGYTYSSPASASTINSLIGSSSFWVYRVNGLGSFGSTTAQETNASSTAYSWATTPTTSTTIKTNSLPTDTGVASSPQNTVVWYGASATTSKSSGTYQATITYTAATL